MIRCVMLLTVALASVGCRSGGWGPYTSPRVTGQVVAADSRKPLAGVSVSRGGIHQRRTNSPPKGAELLIQKVPVQTDSNGEFILESERVLSIFRGSGWNQVHLRFEKPGYLTLQTNYPATWETNSPAGEPWLAIAPVALQPAQK